MADEKSESEEKHTPGPWRTRKPKHPDIRQIKDRLIVAKIDGEIQHVAETYQYRNNDNRDADGTALANAALITHAPKIPELKEKLKFINDEYDKLLSKLTKAEAEIERLRQSRWTSKTVDQWESLTADLTAKPTLNILGRITLVGVELKDCDNLKTTLTENEETKS